MSTTIYCDHCGTPCHGRPDWHGCSLRTPQGSCQFDLCEDCTDELRAFIGRTERYAKRTAQSASGESGA